LEEIVVLPGYNIECFQELKVMKNKRFKGKYFYEELIGGIDNDVRG